jgi:hypothetical protein
MANRNVEPTLGEIFVPGAAPGAPVEGQVYFDSTAHALKVYASSAWQTSATSADLAAKADKATPTPGSYSKVTITGQGVVSAGTTAAIADVTGLQTALDGKVDENAAITGATNTKITYDSKGLVTAGVAATTADIADSTNRRYCTDAQKTVIGNTSGTNTGDQDISGKANLSGAVFTGAVQIGNAGAYGVYAYGANSTSVYGAGTAIGVHGTSSAGFGVKATGNTTKAPLVLDTLSAAPSDTTEGQVYYDSSNHMLRFRNNSTWINVAADASATVAGIINLSDQTLGAGTKTVYALSTTGTAAVGVYGTGTSYGVEGFSTNNPGVYGHSTNNYGVKGSSDNGPGVYAVGTNYGVQCSATAGIGVYATGTTHGGLFEGDSIAGGYGVKATATGASGTNYGGHFTATSGVGLKGVSNGGTGYGLYGVGTVCGVKAESTGDYGLHASSTSTTSGTHYGVYADCSSAGTGNRVGVLGGGTSHGVYGQSTVGIGVYGTSGGTHGIYGDNTHVGAETSYGIYGHCTSSGGGIKCGVAGYGITWGVAGVATTGSGVWGESTSGFGVEAQGNIASAALRLVGAAQPSSVVEGQIYYNSTDKHFYGYNGTTWKQLDN